MSDVNLSRICTSLGPNMIGALTRRPVDGLYVHVPFCMKKCEYCDFYSIATNPAPLMQPYVDAVLREASWWTGYLEGSGNALSTVFLGGGTPTMLPRPLMAQLINGLRQRLPMTELMEWTVEANPATVDRDYCRMLLDCGVNRLSVGAQSFVREELQMLGRVHDADLVRRTVTDAHEAGFQRVSLDMMYGIPGQTVANWSYSLDQALALGIKHISCYCLTLEEGTPMWQKAASGAIAGVSEEVQLQMMRQTRNLLGQHELRPYEISNYALRGEECRHNLVYWRGGNYIGLGPGAAMHLSGRRWRNMPDLSRYLHSVNLGHVEFEDWEVLSLSQRAVELAMLMLRLEEGIDRKLFHGLLGLDPMDVFGHAIDQLEGLGMIRSSVTRITLTEQGIYVADAVIGEMVRG